jgi:hypothetical protein
VSKWNPLNQEGSLYLTKKLPALVETKTETGLINLKLNRSTYEYQLILVNRKEKRDFLETVTANMEFTINGKYVYLKTPGREVHRSTQTRAFFFSEEAEAEKFMQTIESVLCII